MKTHGEDWHAIWQQALKNCPYRLRWVDHVDHDLGDHLVPIVFDEAKWEEYFQVTRVGRYREEYGRYSALCRILGLPMLSKAGWRRDGYVSKGGARVGHLRIEAYIERGSRPRDHELRRKVKILASPFGPTLAMKKLKQLGIAHLYTKP